jgi:outer membrane protein, adhesin transport system
MNARNLLLFSVSAMAVSTASSVDFDKLGPASSANPTFGSPALHVGLATSDEATLNEISILSRKNDMRSHLAVPVQKSASKLTSFMITPKLESLENATAPTSMAVDSVLTSQPEIEVKLEFSSAILSEIEQLSQLEQGNGVLNAVDLKLPASTAVGANIIALGMLDVPAAESAFAEWQAESAVIADDKNAVAALTPVVEAPALAGEHEIEKLFQPEDLAKAPQIAEELHVVSTTTLLAHSEMQPADAGLAVQPRHVEPVVSAVPTVAFVINTKSSVAPLVALADAPKYIFYADEADKEVGKSLQEVPAAATASPLNPVVAAGTSVAAITTAAAADVSTASTGYSGAVSLEQAISAAMETNPEINQAIMNKEAIEFEREQAQGLFLPRVGVEASAGIRRLDNGTRRTLGIDDDLLYPVEGMLTAEQTLIDFGRRKGELRRQAARTDGAALRIVERSENIALLISRQYLNILLQQRVSAAADDNVTFHKMLVSDLGQGVAQGSISIADQQQAQERLQAALVRQVEAQEDLKDAQIILQTLTGLQVESAAMPRSLRPAAPPTLGEAVSLARQNNPKVKEAQADVDAAHALADKAKGDFAPTIGLEARGRAGHDIDGFAGRTNDLQGRVVMRWNLFDGGINRAKYQEMVRRASESRFRLHEMVRVAEEDVQRAWNSMSTQGKVAQELETQSRVSDDLLISYRQQFNVGRRSLLDVLDAQNTRYNVQVRLETARFSEQFAEYQVLASTNTLLESLGLNAPKAGESNARERFGYGPPAPAELQRRRYPR